MHIPNSILKIVSIPQNDQYDHQENEKDSLQHGTCQDFYTPVFSSISPTLMNQIKNLDIVLDSFNNKYLQ